jgi:hypothetical protein
MKNASKLLFVVTLLVAGGVHAGCEEDDGDAVTRICGPAAPDEARSWTVKLTVTDRSDPSEVASGTGIVVNPAWILTAIHVLEGDERVAITREAAERTAIQLPGNAAAEAGWFDNAIPGVGDIVALHVRPEFQERLRGRAAPIDWDFDPAVAMATVGGFQMTSFGFLDNSLNMGRADATLQGPDDTGTPPRNGGQVFINRWNRPTGPGRGIGQHGDSGGPVLTNVPAQMPRVVGVHIGALPRTLQEPYRRQRWVPLNQQAELRRLVTEVPDDLATPSPYTDIHRIDTAAMAVTALIMLSK